MLAVIFTNSTLTKVKTRNPILINEISIQNDMLAYISFKKIFFNLSFSFVSMSLLIMSNIITSRFSNKPTKIERHVIKILTKFSERNSFKYKTKKLEIVSGKIKNNKISPLLIELSFESLRVLRWSEIILPMLILVNILIGVY